MRVRLLFKIMSLSVAFGLAACGSSASDSGEGGSGGTGGAGGAAGGAGGTSTIPVAEGPNGLFDIRYMKETSVADIGGIMWDRPKPEQVIWDKKKTDGDCALYIPRAPFCESCPTGQVCVEMNTCRAQAVARAVGDVTLSGLNSTAKPLPLVSVADTYSSPETLSLPPCTVGGTVKLDASGAGEYPAFSVQAKCIAPLVVPSTSMPLESGKAFTLTWTPGSVAEAHITFEFDLSHHGGSKGQIRCETADSGSLQVSAALMKSLMDLGITGFPWLTVARVAKGTIPVGSGQAQLKIYSEERINLEVPGVISCQKDADCPTGKTCLNTSNMCG